MQGHMSSLLLFFLLPELLCLKSSGLRISKVVPVFEPKTWMDARSYCRNRYSDLASIQNASKSSKVDMYEGWIGLYMTPSNEWKWSIESDELPAGGFEWCLFKNRSIWEVDKCSQHHPFLCVDERLILVQEAKAWEDALQYCRGLQGVERHQEHVYDLASLPESINILLNVNETTDEVWVGLRFLGGEWMWLSGEPVNSSHLPDCPVQDQRCGALDPSNSEWKTISCSERRSFICSINPKYSKRNEL